MGVGIGVVKSQAGGPTESSWESVGKAYLASLRRVPERGVTDWLRPHQ